MPVVAVRFYTADQAQIESWAQRVAERTPKLWYWELALSRNYANAVVVEGQPTLTSIFDVILGFKNSQDVNEFLSGLDWRRDYDNVCA
jgi:hypothetical protein